MLQGLVVPRSKERKRIVNAIMKKLVILVNKEFWKKCEKGIFGTIGLD
jgi:hypothetical protein